MRSGLAAARRLALRAGAPIPQKLPGINSQLVPIAKMKLDRVLTHAFRRSRFHNRLEHRQSPRRGFRRLSRLLVRLRPLFVTQRARTSIPQEGKRIMRLMPILPLDIETCSRAQVHLYRLRVRHSQHEFSIAQRNSGVFLGPRICPAKSAPLPEMYPK